MTRRSSGAGVGIVANPAAGRDIRRLVAQASVFPLAEKCNMVLRILSGLTVSGVEEAHIMEDRGGVAARISRILETPAWRQRRLPRVSFVETREDGPAGTLTAARTMAEAGVRALIVLGGDGTHRLVAQVCGDIPMTALSTGTNNVFPSICEATTAGIATGLVATGRLSRAAATMKNKILRVQVNGIQELALVDVCVSRARWTGARALWHPQELDQLFVTFAEADSIGLSAVAGLLRPVSRRAGYGLRLDLAPLQEAAMTVTAPIAPGHIRPVGVAAIHELRPDERHAIRTRQGVIAVDGERELEFGSSDQVRIWLDRDGPCTIMIDRVMELAAEKGLLTEGQAPELDRSRRVENASEQERGLEGLSDHENDPGV